MVEQQSDLWAWAGLTLLVFLVISIVVWRYIKRVERGKDR